MWRPRRIELLNGHDVKYEPTYELCTWETRPSGNAVVTCYATAYGVSAPPSAAPRYHPVVASQI